MYEKVLINELLYLLYDIVSNCDDYNGIENSRGEFCCPKTCEACGEPECYEDPDNENVCCEINIERTRICGLDAQMAPCWLVA